jgi:acyl carrier protein
MGLDGVELVMEAEERFGIAIPDGEASNVWTVGDFFELICRKLPTGGSSRCMTATAFYRLRRGFVKVLGINGREVHPQRLLSDLLPREQRQRTWPLLSAATGLKMPKLTRPGWVVLIIVLSGVIGFVAGILDHALTHRILSGLEPLAALVVAMTLGVLVSRPLAVCPEGDCRTIGDLAKEVSSRNPGRLVAAGGAADRRQVWESVVRLVAYQLGTKQEDITYTARFSEDLNMD